MTYPYLSGVNYESVVDGPGVRVALFLSGCTHNCKGCHNPETHDPCYGQEITSDTIDGIVQYIQNNPPTHIYPKYKRRLPYLLNYCQ